MPTGAYYPAGVVTPNDWDVYDFDTTTNFAGVTDFTAATQAAIDGASAAGTGGDVYLPPGVIRLNGVTINSGGVNLIGCGWEEFTSGGAYRFAQRGKRGTYVITDDPTKSAVVLGSAAANARIADIAFLQPHQQDVPGWLPTAFPPSILGQGPNTGSIIFERLLFWGTYKGIDLGTVSNAVGRIAIRDCYFATFNTGIHVVNCPDILTIDNCNYYNQLLAGSPNIQLYNRLNAFFITLDQSLKPVLTNISANGCAAGLYVTSSYTPAQVGAGAATPQRVKVIGADFSDVGIGLYENGIGIFVAVLGMTHVGQGLGMAGMPVPPAGAPGYRNPFSPGNNTPFSLAVASFGNSPTIDVVDLHASLYEGPAAVCSAGVRGLGDVKFGPNCWFDNWNNNPTAVTFASVPNPAPAVFVSANGLTVLSNNCRFTNANGGPQAGFAFSGGITRF